MIDSDFKVYMIEVNVNPCLEETNTFLKRILDRMLDEMFQLTIDKIFGNGLSDYNETGWEFISNIYFHR